MLIIKYCPPRGVSRNLGNPPAYVPASEVMPTSEVMLAYTYMKRSHSNCIPSIAQCYHDGAFYREVIKVAQEVNFQ